MATEKRSESLTGSAEKRSASGDGDGEKRQKLSFGLSKPTSGSKTTNNKTGLQFKLNTKSAAQPLVNKNTSVFNNESDEEPEQIPPEARMRMRNFGRDTPTSSGPNSFGKTKHGFCNVKKIYEKNLSAEAESQDNSK